jgi:hypothetical protein
MDVGVCHDGLARPAGPSDREPIEVIQCRRVKGIELHGVEEVGVLLE